MQSELQATQRERWVAAVALFSTMVLAATLPAYLLSVHISRIVHDMDNRVALHDIGINELSRDRDALLARFRDVSTEVSQQMILVQELSERIATCQRDVSK